MKEFGIRALTVRFALGSAAIICAAGILLFVGIREYAEANLEEMAERNNVAITRAYANALWPRYSGFIRATRGMSVDEIRTHTLTAQLRADTVELMSGLSVVKVKIYDETGRTAFSTQPSQIGNDKSTNEGFRSALNGTVRSELYHRDTFSSFEHEISERDLVSSYIPIVGRNHQVEGVAEVYTDLTDHLARERETTNTQFSIVASALLLIYAGLMAFAYHRNRTVLEQHRENIALAAEAAAAAEESRMKSEFLANMSHELRTPLNAILGFSETMRSQLFGPLGNERYRAYADDIWTSGKLLLDIVNDVLNMSKIASGNLELDDDEFELRDLITDSTKIVGPAANRKSISLKVCRPPESLWLLCDRRRMKQVLLNVLSNAIKFSYRDNAIEIAAANTANGGLEIRIADHGVGIAAEMIPHVLKPFGQVSGSYSREQGGTGLGLPIAKSFMELHDGTLAIDSVPGKGTTIILTLPPARIRRSKLSASGSVRVTEATASAA